MIKEMDKNIDNDFNFDIITPLCICVHCNMRPSPRAHVLHFRVCSIYTNFEVDMSISKNFT